MKRQAVGVRSNEVEQTETNSSKRMKLLQNEGNKGAYEMDCSENKSMMDTTLNENTHSHNNGEHFLSNNDSSAEHVSGGHTEKNDVEQNTSEVINENGSFEKGDINHMTESNCNGSCDDIAVKGSSSDSGIVSELHNSNTLENSCEQSDENQSTVNKENVSPVLNQDVHNSESTDSFQSEGFEADNLREAANEVLEANTSPGLNNDAEEISFELNGQKSIIDLDNLLMSHVKVTELPGHSDIVYSVAADEDLVLSASGDTTVRVWSVERLSTISTFSGHSDSVTSLLLLNQNQSKILKKKMSFAKVSRIAITGSYDCHIKLWSVLEGKELASVYTFNGISCLGYLESECLVVVGTEGGKIELWDLSSSKAVKSVHAHEDLVSDVKVQDNYIYSVSIDGTVKVWVYEDDDIYPVYTRKRKEISTDKKEFVPTQWKTVSVSDNIMYLGDNSSNIKVLDWRSGRLRLFKNQNEDQGICESVIADKNMLFTTYFDSSSDSGGINVWKLPEMTYVCTLTGAVTDICSLAVVPRENGLRVVSGSHGLLVWDFDFSKPLNPQDEYCVKELETLGNEIDEKSVDIKSEAARKSQTSIPYENKSSERWCNVM